MKYFAYGSNMCINRLHKRVPSCKYISLANIKRYDLRFHKLSADNSGKCNAYFTGLENNEVIGVIFDIDEQKKNRLDNAEGVGYGYHEIAIDVETDNGQLNVFMYVADIKYIDDTLAPYSWYKDFVLNGAKQHGLPQEYINSIEKVLVRKDPDEQREKEMRNILPC